MKVLLIFPPFVLHTMPSLALSSLKGALLENSIETEVIYANLLFKKRLFPGIYENFAQSHSYFWLLGDYIFASEAFPEAREKHAEFEREMNRFIESDQMVERSINSYTITPETVSILKNSAAGFLDEITTTILEKKPDVVGFGALFQQTVAAIAIANRIKKEAPHITTVMGGANCLDPMGPEFAKITPAIDYIFMGEAEQSLPEFCLNLAKGLRPEGKLIQCTPYKDINRLPLPDYADFFSQLDQHGFINKEEPAFPFNHIYVESNRGCNLSKYKQCSFCGYYYPPFREKRGEKVLADIKKLAESYNVRSFTMADNVMANKMIKEVFAKLDDNYIDAFNFSGRVDSITLEELSILRKKCRSIISFAGLESFHDRHLSILNKKTTTADNIRFLRDCRSLNITVSYFLLNSIPGESEAEYREMMELLPLLHHLESPSYVFPVIPVRFSNFFDDPDSYGIRNIRPPQSFKYIFPDEAEVKNLPVFFESETDSPLDNRAFREEFFSVARSWIDIYEKEPPRLELIKEGAELYVEDSREIRKSDRKALDESSYRLLKAFETPSTLPEALTLVKKMQAEQQYEELLASNYLVNAYDNIVSLVIDKSLCERE